MNDTKEVPQVKPFLAPKIVLSMLPCVFFLYVNCVMMFALLRKPALLESSRYILFCHLLFTDSLQLLLSMLLYVFAVTRVKMISHVCITIIQLASTTVMLSPLTLAVMSLERYVAICFPLTHANIATSRRTGIAITVVWTMASLNSFTQLFLFYSLENASFTVPRFCNTRGVLRLQIYLNLNTAFNTVYFVLVSVIIIYTYIAIMITVKSASSSVRNGYKAQRTVLLHLLQLCLCLTSTLFNMIHTNTPLNSIPVVALHTQYILFVGLIVLPKCLSPLIYGLRDQILSHVFKYYFTFGIKTTVCHFPKF